MKLRHFALALVLVLTRALAGENSTAWTPAQLALLASLELRQLPAAPRDPSNRYADQPAAAALGKQLFFDRRLSANGQVACASCHDPGRQFQDGRALSQGMATGTRRAMPLLGSSRSAWFFWDGRKDSLWAQALGPLEDAAEHGGNRLGYVRLLSAHYQRDYETIFGPLPSLQGLPLAAGPLGSEVERAAWMALGEAQRDGLNRAFANMGKAIAAYEAGLQHQPNRLDAYIEAVLHGQDGKLSAGEQRGLRIFIGKGECVRCHGGALQTDGYFHNTGVVPRLPGAVEAGRASAVAKVLADEFNCLGRYSDAAPGACQELAFINRDDPRMAGAFKTPSLRGVGSRAPYMHAGQLTTLDAVVRHYVAAPAAVTGKSERQPLHLSEQEIADLVSFLELL
ncbi:MAG: cytochrome-c peroxidase [Massilia sp.]